MNWTYHCCTMGVYSRRHATENENTRLRHIADKASSHPTMNIVYTLCVNDHTELIYTSFFFHSHNEYSHMIIKWE